MSDTSDNGERVDPKIATIGIGGPGVEPPIKVPVASFFDAYLAIHALGGERAQNVMIFGAGLTQKLREQPEPVEAFRQVLSLLADEQAPPGINPRELEPHVQGFCYLLLRQRVISWEQAAGIATALLGANPPIGAEAWRKKMERWIQRTGRAKVGKRRPRE
ncbi:MAG TPA: hypothetical protein VLA19_06635 [Herpetosiphonaceae bacterium]|nr:hypothetical protein [Herpetosiphonaceae bacterium]